MGVNLDIVLHWSRDEPNHFPRVTIYRADVSDPIHDQFLILVYVAFMTKMAGMVWYGIQSSFSPVATCLLVIGMDLPKSLPNTVLSNPDPLGCQKTAHCLSSICWSHLNKEHNYKSIQVYSYV